VSLGVVCVPAEPAVEVLSGADDLLVPAEYEEWEGSVTSCSLGQ